MSKELKRLIQKRRQLITAVAKEIVTFGRREYGKNHL